MFIDNRNKGLVKFQAHKALKRVIWKISQEVKESNPDKTEAECKALAAEIYAARQRETERKDRRPKNKGRRKQPVKAKQKTHTVEVTVVNPVQK